MPPDDSKRIMILGTGRMSLPAIEYLIRQTEYHIVLADMDLDQAQARAEGYPAERTTCITADISSPSDSFLEELKRATVVIGLMPAAFCLAVTELCIEAKTHLVTASYVTDAMQKLDGEARAAGVLVLGETGLDPGLDHMAAVQVINEIRSKGGTVSAMTSSCGGLPYNTSEANPLGYKISWSPETLLKVLRSRSARFMKNGEIIDVPPHEVFSMPQRVRFESLPNPELETYPNGNAERYLKLYGIESARHGLRASLRYRGWNAAFLALHRLGWFSDKPAYEVAAHSRMVPGDDPARAALDWLGLTDEMNPELTAFDYLTQQFVSSPELQYSPGERDLVVMQNVLDAEGIDDSGGRMSRFTATLIVTGDDGGYTAMAKTVGYPAAIAGRLIADGTYSETGMQIPTAPELYEPLLKEMADLGIAFEKTKEVTSDE